jgi:hypothetical protein
MPIVSLFEIKSPPISLDFSFCMIYLRGKGRLPSPALSGHFVDVVNDVYDHLDQIQDHDNQGEDCGGFALVIAFLFPGLIIVWKS